MALLMQKDLQIVRISGNGSGEYEYQLHVMGDPIRASRSYVRFDFGVINVNGDEIDPEKVFHMELYRNCDSVPEFDLKDENTFTVPITERV